MANQSGSFRLASYDWSNGTLECRWAIYDRGDNKSDVYAELWASTNGFRTFGTGYFTFRIGGVDGKWGDGSVDIPANRAWTKIGNWSRTVDHDASGYMSTDIGVLAGEVYGTSFNSIAYNGVNLIYRDGTNYIVAPYAPLNLSVRAGSVSPYGFGVDYSRNTYDAPDRADQAHYSTTDTFSHVNFEDNGPAGYSGWGGATPATNYAFRVRSHTAAGWGPWSATLYQRTKVAPPTSLYTNDIRTDGMALYWDRYPNGSDVSNWEIQYASNSSFSNAANLVVGGGDGAAWIGGLIPGTTYWFRIRGSNSEGYGDYSGTIAQTTLPAVPPGFIVTSGPSGQYANLSFTPPGGVSGVSRYVWEVWISGGNQVTWGETTSTAATQYGLNPGWTYAWRAFANIGGYQSPWTDWITLKQAQPNLGVGDFFSGSTPDTGELTYDWTGAAEESPSTLTMRGVEGWDFSVSGGGGVMAQSYSGAPGLGTYAARMIFQRDCTVDGQHFGQSWNAGYSSEISAGATYVGSIHVRPSKSQSLAAFIVWLDDALTVVGTTTGTPTLVPAGTWVRLSVGGGAVPTATKAVIRAIDLNASGWTPWHSGDIIDLDGAMITLTELFPYFSGGTADDATYVYDWLGVEHASVSKRTPRASLPPGSPQLVDAPRVGARALLDPNCLPPSPPRPPTIPSDCITEAGIWRRTTATIPAVMISDYLDVVPTFEIVTISKAISQVRVRIYPNHDNLPVDQVDLSLGWISEQIIAYVPTDTVLTIDGVHQRVYAAIGGEEAIAADHLLYGTGGTPASWPVLSCGMDYIITADLPQEIAQEDSRLHAYLTTRY